MLINCETRQSSCSTLCNKHYIMPAKTTHSWMSYIFFTLCLLLLTHVLPTLIVLFYIIMTSSYVHVYCNGWTNFHQHLQRKYYTYLLCLLVIFLPYVSKQSRYEDSLLYLFIIVFKLTPQFSSFYFGHLIP